MANITAAELLKRFGSISAGMPTATLAGAVKGGKIMQAAVASASGKYARSALTRTRASNYPNGIGTFKGPAVQVKMTNRRAHLLDHDTKPHIIEPGALTGRRTQSPVLANKVTGFYSTIPVNHPKTSGKFMWEKGLAVARPLIADAMANAVGDQMLKVFK